MKSLEEIFVEGRSTSDIISDLKTVHKNCMAWSECSKAFEPNNHPIKSDPTRRPAEKLSQSGKREVPAKIAYPAEMIATRRMTQMAFSIPVKRVYAYDSSIELEKLFVRAIENVYSTNRIDGINAKRMYAYFGSCEASTYWYIVPSAPHNKYGFKAEGKIRCKSFSPMPSKYSNMSVSNIYPMFDSDNDLIALSYEYTNYDGSVVVNHFDCFTADSVYYFENREDSNEWTMTSMPNAVRKIPASYICRPLPVYDGIEDYRDDCEFSISRSSDNLRKNSTPIVCTSGDLVGDGPVGDYAREVYSFEDGGDMKLLSPALTTASSIEHIHELKDTIEEMLQLPSLTMDKMKSSGTVTGEARKTLLMDAHLKVRGESHEITLFFEREFEVIKSLLCILEPKFAEIADEVSCTHVITPFIQSDELQNVDVYSKACQKPVMSQATAIAKLGIVDDVDDEMNKIREEQEAEAKANQITSIFEGGM